MNRLKLGLATAVAALAIMGTAGTANAAGDLFSFTQDSPIPASDYAANKFSFSPGGSLFGELTGSASLGGGPAFDSTLIFSGASSGQVHTGGGITTDDFQFTTVSLYKDSPSGTAAHPGTLEAVLVGDATVVKAGTGFAFSTDSFNTLGSSTTYTFDLAGTIGSVGGHTALVNTGTSVAAPVPEASTMISFGAMALFLGGIALRRKSALRA